MKDLGITTNVTYTYKTTDGRKFDFSEEAQEWQLAINVFDEIIMLDSNFKPTKEVECAFYVRIKNAQQLHAFDIVSTYYGVSAVIHEPGDYFYDDCTEDYVDINKSIKTLQNMLEQLGAAAKEQKED